MGQLGHGAKNIPLYNQFWVKKQRGGKEKLYFCHNSLQIKGQRTGQGVAQASDTSPPTPTPLQVDCRSN